jgi:PTH1 family peptidyl-tRNA hydrolase
MNDERRDLRLIVGLGNPGRRYAGTRHNLGYEVLEELGRRHGIEPTRRKFRGGLGEGMIAGHRVVLLQPKTYMNLSGESVAPAMRFYDLPLTHLLVICDDVHLPPGGIRLRRSGSAGGHNGLISIIQHLGSESFPRLRIGIGEPPPGLDQVRYVLMPFRREEMAEVREAIDLAADAVEAWLGEGIEAAMSRFN